MKHPLHWALIALLLAGLGLGIGRAIITRKAQQAELAQSTATARSGFLQLSPTDWFEVQAQDLVRAVAVSGSIKAPNSAIVKAKVASELTTLPVREGDAVRHGQLIGTLDPQEFQTRLRQAQEQVATAKAQAQIAQQTLDNNRALVQQGFISKNALDTSASNAAATHATLQAAVAAADLAQKALRDTRLIAPINGLVSQRFAQAGERIPVDGRVVEIVDLSTLELDATLSPDDVAMVHLGSLARIQVDGVPAPIDARIVRINPSTVAGTRSITVYLALSQHPALRQGLFAQGQIELDKHKALAVPTSAVRTEGQRATVQLIQDGRVLRRTVTLGASSRLANAAPDAPAMAAVISGLNAGDRILRESVGQVSDGTPVRMTPPSASSAPR
ncbi:MAG: efflux RND transporter periplasmic adaptor subunit [Burkholderiales bacterium]|nr:efflux RND transporter periplasmic adaptor subunit [Burkholderiales bacterium]